MQNPQIPVIVAIAILLVGPTVAAAQTVSDKPAAPAVETPVESSLSSLNLRREEAPAKPRLFSGLHREDFVRAVIRRLHPQGCVVAPLSGVSVCASELHAVAELDAAAHRHLLAAPKEDETT